MDINSLEEWLRKSRQAGFTDKYIREQLLASGWSEQQITDLFSGDLERKEKLASVGGSGKDSVDAMFDEPGSQS